MILRAVTRTWDEQPGRGGDPKLTLGAYATPRTVAVPARWQAFLKRTDTTEVGD